MTRPSMQRYADPVQLDQETPSPPSGWYAKKHARRKNANKYAGRASRKHKLENKLYHSER